MKLVLTAGRQEYQHTEKEHHWRYLSNANDFKLSKT